MSIQELDPSVVSSVMSEYRPGTGSDRYIRFIEDVMGERVGSVQRRLLESLESSRRTVAIGANGVGKSYGIGALGGIAALYCNPSCTVNVTSGSYGQLDDTIWKPIKSVHRSSPLPGRTLDNKRELKSGLDGQWYLKCLSPRHPADLEGRHNRRMIYIVEEADKPGITSEHIDSIESTATDSQDRVIVLANPPKNQTNSVADLMAAEKWETLRFSSFESRNVQIDVGNKSGEKIPGLVELSEIKENWEDWNESEWPGHEEAFSAHRQYDTLDERWYRRRAGVVPPEDTGVWRPLSPSAIREAYRRDPVDLRIREMPTSVGIDVARSDDMTVMVGVHDRELRVHYAERGTDHTIQLADLSEIIREFPALDIAVDAVGEGSGLADELSVEFPNVTRFSNGMKPVDESEYYDSWAESLDLLGEFLENGFIRDENIRKELLVAAGTITFSERSLQSRGGPSGTNVIEASKKEKVTDELGHSPDYLDAALMAVWTEAAIQKSNQQLTW